MYCCCRNSVVKPFFEIVDPNSNQTVKTTIVASNMGSFPAGKLHSTNEIWMGDKAKAYLIKFRLCSQNLSRRCVLLLGFMALQPRLEQRKCKLGGSENQQKPRALFENFNNSDRLEWWRCRRPRVCQTDFGRHVSGTIFDHGYQNNGNFAWDLTSNIWSPKQTSQIWAKVYRLLHQRFIKLLTYIIGFFKPFLLPFNP